MGREGHHRVTSDYDWGVQHRIVFYIDAEKGDRRVQMPHEFSDAVSHVYTAFGEFSMFTDELRKLTHAEVAKRAEVAYLKEEKRGSII